MRKVKKGEEFGYYEVINIKGNVVECRCKLCGTIKEIQLSNLVNGKIKMCRECYEKVRYKIEVY